LFNSMNIDSLWKTSHDKVFNDKTLNDYTSNERKTSFILSNDRTTNALRTSNRRTKLRRIVQKVEIKYVESFKTPNRTNCQSITIKYKKNLEEIKTLLIKNIGRFTESWEK
jgi:hypothetical protein